MEQDDPKPIENRRGGDGAPAEGRRIYDRPDVSLDRVEKMFALADVKLARFRRFVATITALVGLVVAAFTWLGFRTMGPGARTDELQVIVDHNKSERTYTDSVISFRLTRLERVVTTMAYQSCMRDAHTPQDDCNKIFTSGVDQTP